MAIGLAVAHYHAQIDCADTEFVLGTKASVPQTPYFVTGRERVAPHTISEIDFTGRTVHLWDILFVAKVSAAIHVVSERTDVAVCLT